MADDADPAAEPRDAELARLRLELAASRSEAATLRADLAQRDAALAEAHEQQAATGEVLRVVAASPTDLQVVLDAIASAAGRFTTSDNAMVQQVDGDLLVPVG